MLNYRPKDDTLTHYKRKSTVKHIIIKSPYRKIRIAIKLINCRPLFKGIFGDYISRSTGSGKKNIFSHIAGGTKGKHIWYGGVKYTLNQYYNKINQNVKLHKN